jgi:hypothetical protein
MTERRFTDEEVADIFAAATEERGAPPHSGTVSAGLTLAQLQEIGREVGLSPEAITRAAVAVQSRGQNDTRRYLGLPIGVERTIPLHRWLTDPEWEHLVVELREVFRAKGTVRSSGSFREWTNGNLQALLEPTESGHRLRLRTRKGDAQALLGAGLGALGVTAALAAAMVLNGRLGAAMPGIGFLALVGLGMLGSAAVRVLPWARERARQMEGIAARLTLPPPAED